VAATPERTPDVGGGPRLPGVVFLALSVAIAVAIAAVAISTTQTEPPTVAEFAPKAVERIEDAPDEQSTRFGADTVAVPGGQRTTANPTVADDVPPINVPRALHCVGAPPRQIEDPQSPPCVPYWEGDNGGATAQGVTASEITVAWPLSIEQIPDIRTLEAFFNSRFQLYGRKIRLRPYSPTGGTFGPADPPAMNSDAAGVDAELEAFASLMYVPRDGAERQYYDELARREIVSVDARQSLRDSAHLARWSPYEWATEPGIDVTSRTTAEWICKTLKGSPAIHAGPDVPKDGPRTFAVLSARAEDGSKPDPELLSNGIAGCGGTVVSERTLNADNDDLAEGQNVVLDLKLDEVTSVLCLCTAEQLKSKLMPAATAQGYSPEWLLQPFQFQDRETAATEWPQDQAARAFGVSFRNKWLAPEDMPWFWAMKEIDPSWEPDPAQQGWNQAVVERYSELLILASGIQLAGPTLNAATLHTGLQRAEFPNPGCGREPYFQACVSFGGDHTFHDDGMMTWWSPTQRNYTANQRQGAFCYVGSGVRYGLGKWPTGSQPFFEGPCR